MADLNELTAHEIGRRLRLARESAKIRQDEAAKVIGMSRPTLVSIEKGDRRAADPGDAAHGGVLGALLLDDAHCEPRDLLPPADMVDYSGHRRLDSCRASAAAEAQEYSRAAPAGELPSILSKPYMCYKYP